MFREHPWAPVPAVWTKIAELLRLSAEGHRLDPVNRFAVIADATGAYLSDLIKSGLVLVDRFLGRKIRN